MTVITRSWRVREDEGASSVEYGLLVVAIAAVIVLVVFALGTWVKGTYRVTCNSLSQPGYINADNSGSNVSTNCNQ